MHNSHVRTKGIRSSANVTLSFVSRSFTQRFRRQLYSVQLTKHGDGFYLGLATVLEWPKDVDTEASGSEQPAFERDTTNVYLVTSRDGVHIDDGWVYAQRPLLPKGAMQKDWNAGFFLPAAQILSDAESHRVYYEARAGSAHHEFRFNGTAVVGLAEWPRDRIVGVRQAHAHSPGIMVTKAFELQGDALWVDVDVGAGAAGMAFEAHAMSGLAVEVLDLQGSARGGFSRNSSRLVNASNGAGRMLEVRWATSETSGTPSLNLGDAIAGGNSPFVRLRFALSGGLRLFSFQVRGEPPPRGAAIHSTDQVATTTRAPPKWMSCAALHGSAHTSR